MTDPTETGAGPPTAETAAALLARNGLGGPEFDPAETAELLAGWGEADAQLDDLLASASAELRTGDPVNFQASWQ